MMYDNCHVCDVICQLGKMLRCHDCNHRFCSATCAGFALAPPGSNLVSTDIIVTSEANWIARNCVICRGEKMNDTIAYGYLLELTGMSRETAQELIRGHILCGGLHRSK